MKTNYYSILNLQENLEDYEQLHAYTSDETIDFVNDVFEESISDFDTAVNFLKSNDFMIIPIVNISEA